MRYSDVMKQNKELCQAAIKATEHSYSPYSNYKVGAAILCKDGKIYTGCNIESVSFTPTVCAERVALFNAISDGRRDFVKIAVVGMKNGEVQSVFPPCGVCRQVLTEFCNPEFEILLINSFDDYTIQTLEELLPYSFKNKKIDMRNNYEKNI